LGKNIAAAAVGGAFLKSSQATTKAELIENGDQTKA
jgi:hypothetical protein